MNARTMARSTAALCAVGILGLGAAACGSNSATGGETTAATTTASDGGGVAAPSDGGGGSVASDSGGGMAGTSSPSSSPSPSDTSTASSSSGSGATDDDVATCEAGDLQATATQGDSSAGHVHYDLTFTNSSDDPCRLSGFPGVSVVAGGEGEQIGAAAEHADDEGEPTVLIPGGTAHATIEAVNIGDDGGPLGDSCTPVDADGWRVYPPDSTKALFIRQEGMKTCSGDADWLTITGVHPAS